jgi:uncharacterized protein with PIN domain
MKICVECMREPAGDLEHCPHCGGELRHRSISEAMIELTEENAVTDLQCPQCGAKVAPRSPRSKCPSCGVIIAKAYDAEGRRVLIRH